MTNRKPTASMKRASIFLNGSYPEEHLDFYRRAITAAAGERTLIAVDGGADLFLKLNLTPDLIVGDFDSLSDAARQHFAECAKEVFPVDKDSTDGELAVFHCLENGCRDIKIYGAIDTDFETDQMLANLFLLQIVNDWSLTSRRGAFAAAIDHRQEIVLLRNGSVQLPGSIGDGLSIIPISPKSRLTIRGAKWNLDFHQIRWGDTHAVRNEFASKRIKVEISGSAFVIHRRSS